MAEPTTSPQISDGDIRVDVIDDPADFTPVFDVIAAAFGRQIEDAIWMSMNKGWDTPEGRELGIKKQIRHWENIGKLHDGRPANIFTKATIADPSQPGGRRVVGVALWEQWSPVDGWGDKPSPGLPPGAAARLHPDDEKAQHFVSTVAAALYKRRYEVAMEKATENPPAVFVMDLCVTDPLYQGRGVATKLVRYGMDEAQRRGGLECVTEASAMGRSVYKRLGFHPEGDGRDIDWGLGDEYSDVRMPPNVFLRTGPPK